MRKILAISQIQFLTRQNVQFYRTNPDGNVPIEITDNQSVFENVKIRKISRQDDVCVGVTSVRGKTKEPIRSFENSVFSKFPNFINFSKIILKMMINNRKKATHVIQKILNLTKNQRRMTQTS